MTGTLEAVVGRFWSVRFKRHGAKVIAVTVKARRTRPLIPVAA
ncbi:hypothetical protein MPNT_210024 [Candidatus Methylacidithermus pantelleriae]|uniref:Uncharacterized protein n=1 Tax=Candidatus Methylacidithermus pantelleriae TaxID=2744239 RepID=A0A8J2BJG9_9BACT|nr:hypothetical protein MPNT_210024 [Candidatus Methylacidithermus pantelleriae]